MARDTSWVSALIGVLLLGSCGYIAYATRRSDSREKENRAATIANDSVALKELASKHHAVAAWRDEVPESVLLAPFTFELEAALVRADSAPVLLVATLDDIRRKGTQRYVAQFSDADVFSDIRYELEISPERLSELARLGRGEFRASELLLVARIQEVRRVALAIGSDTELTDDFTSSAVTLDAEPVFRAVGTLVDFAPRTRRTSAREGAARLVR